MNRALIGLSVKPPGDTMKSRSNPLGEIRAETDVAMLDNAFLETADYRTLIESTDKVVIIGRRGTGKSALTYKLEKYWNAVPQSRVITLAPEEDQVIALRPILERLGGRFNLIKSAVRISWEYLLMNYILDGLSRHYRFGRIARAPGIEVPTGADFIAKRDCAYNLKILLAKGLPEGAKPESSIGELVDKLGYASLKEAMSRILDETKTSVFVLIDRLDEGYVPDDTGVAYMAGIVQGTLNVNSWFSQIRPVLFIRDNMFRAIAGRDPDYSRNIEGSSLRLHWTEMHLLNLAAKRLRLAFALNQENDIKAWTSVASGQLCGRAGFTYCLRLTLYRPRDLLALLNEAFFVASRDSRDKLTITDIDSSAKEISRTRLDDLQKEYQAVFPAIKPLTNAFANKAADLSVSEAEEILRAVLQEDRYEPATQQDIEIFKNPRDVISNLYGIGFIGIKNDTSGSFIFCHDGRSPNFTITPEDRLLIHPCYQVVLNMTKGDGDPGSREEIYDDYGIKVDSVSQDQRNKIVGQLISRLKNIDLGHEGASDFEAWCYEAIRMAFAGSLRNIEMHPNKGASQRRDIVAHNPALDDFWQRVLNDYKTRQVIFEVKNFSDLGADEFRQMASYLVDTYGQLGFIVYRSEEKEPDKEKTLKWVREMYSTQRKLIIPLSYRWLTGFLEKIRNPQKHDAVNKALNKLIDAYHRRYLNEGR